MGKVEDEHDIPTSERGDRNYKVGFKGFDWWWSRTHVALPLAWGYGEWYGPMGYENGSWVGAHLYIHILFFGCRIDWIKRWEPKEPTLDKVPRKRPVRARKSSPEAIVARMAEDETFAAELRRLLQKANAETPESSPESQPE